MSDPNIWLPGGRAYPVVENNQKLTQSGGSVRRLFLVNSAQWLDEHGDYKSALCKVLKLQRSMGIHVGMLFKDMVPPGHVKDLAVYYAKDDSRICWIETLTSGGTPQGSEGFFSSLDDDGHQCEATLRKLWGEHDPDAVANSTLASSPT